MTASFRTLLLAGAALAAAFAAPARADDVTPDQAAQAEAAVRTWLGDTLGPAVKLPERPVRMTPAGDHFDVSMPIPLPDSPTGVVMTATARPLDAGKWAIDNLRTALPLQFTLRMPVPNEDKTKPPATVPVHYEVDARAQDGHGIIDPGFATATTLSTSSQGLTIRTQGGPAPHLTAVDSTSSVMTIQPAGPERVDVTSTGTAEGYHITFDSQNHGSTKVDLGSLRVAMAITGLDRGRAQVISQNVTTVLAAVFDSMPAGGGVPSTPPRIRPEVASALLTALQDVATEISLDEEAQNVAVQAGGIAVGLVRARLGMGGRSDGGVLQAHMDLGADGITAPGALPPVLEALIPTQVALRPTVSGIGVAEAVRLLNAAGAKQQPDPADIMAMFSHGGIKAGVESMTLAVGGATFTGTGQVVATSPDEKDVTGTARITAANLDALVQTVSKTPFAQQAMPVLVFAKGIGKTDNNQIVWDIDFRNGKLLVNDVDLMAMAGGGSGGAQAAPAAPTPKQPATPGPARPSPNARRPAH